MKTFFYTSSEVRQAIADLFSAGSGRRIAISAFVGDGAEAFLPRPRGLELICWPKEGGTNPKVLRKLMKLGVRVFFSDSLHMKVYWADGQGAVISSANLSTNALGSGNLKEVGVILDAQDVQIDRLLAGLKRRQVSRSELLKLDRLHNAYVARNRIRTRPESESFCEWYESPFRPEWKLTFYQKTTERTSLRAQAVLDKQYGLEEGHSGFFDRQRGYEQGDWVLLMKLGKASVGAVGWLFVDFIVKVSRADQKAYDPENPFELVQAWPLKRYPGCPFRIDAQFRAKLSEAIQRYERTKLLRSRSALPPSELIDRIYSFYDCGKTSR